MRALAVVGVIAGVLSSSCAIQPNDHTLPGQAAVGDDGYTVHVHFDQIENLVPNSTVQKDNVVIGTVGEIEVDGWEAVVELHLLDDVQLPGDAMFSIGQKTLLGAQYVEVSAAPAATDARVDAVLRQGDVIGVEQTGSYPATEQVLGAVALLLNNGGLSQISTITGELSTALEGRVPDTRNLIRHTNELLVVLDTNRNEIVSALESLDALSAGLNADQRKFVNAVKRISPGLRVLEEERENLVKAVTDTARVSKRAVRVVQVNEAALLTNLDSLGPILTNLGQVSESLPEALKLGLTIPWPAMTTRNAIKGDYLNLFTTVDLRTTTLDHVWLNGVSPALQAGNPLADPLIIPDAASGAGPDSGGRLTDQLDDQLGKLLNLPRGQGDGAGSSAGKTSCLLSLLGLC
ncbi:MCE family protein [Nocardioides sp. GCM10030258]|uniref:MCE family protein n=1 Tax=unclassified Nocardioides TaxID=2615069 RepID=UPI003612C913